MKVKVKIYSCYELTYRKIYREVVKKLYGKNIDIDSVVLEVEDVSKDAKGRLLSLRCQRSSNKYVPRIIRIYEDNKLVHIVGMSNTNFDLDKKNEYEKGLVEKKYVYGSSDYHANTYFKQGTPAIFNYFYDQKKINDDIKLSFYLLDTEKNYPHTLYNVLSYRELETIGFSILNLDEINFEEYNKVCYSSVNCNNIAFSSFLKYASDISIISKQNKGNTPAFIRCEEKEEMDDNGTSTYLVNKYSYTFKSLAAQGYDSLFKCWCLKTLADKEKISIEFRLGIQYFAYTKKELKEANKWSGNIEKTFSNANVEIIHITDETFKKEIRKSEEVFLNCKKRKNLRNQPLFKNSLINKGVPLICPVSGEDNPTMLEAAHILSVKTIKSLKLEELKTLAQETGLLEGLDSKHIDDNDYLRYLLINSGDNGIFLRVDYHRKWDNGLLKIEEDDFPSGTLTKATKAFLRAREKYQD